MKDQQFDPAPPMSFILFLAIVSGMLIGFWIGYIGRKSNIDNKITMYIEEFQQKAIENNAAYYDAKTGDFKWNNEKPK
jgi:membrane protein DedA with SNARE-associated domain